MTTNEICIAGKNEIAVKFLRHLLKRDHETFSLTVCPVESDRGTHTWQPSLRKVAMDLGIPIVELGDLYNIEDLVFLSLEYDRIIKPQRFKSNKLYNLHFSLLPAYKGVFTSILPILHGERQTGVTLHKIDNGIDTGDILHQEHIEITADLNSFQLYKRYSDLGYKLLVKNFDKIIEGEFAETPQSPIGSTYYWRSAIDLSALEIEFNTTAYQAHNKIRALRFRPYQMPRFNGRAISHSVLTNSKSSKKHGTFECLSDGSYCVSTIDYDITLHLDRLDTLLEAAKADDVVYVDKCLQLGYDLDDRNSKGWSPLIAATYNESWKVFNYLLNKGINVDSCNNNGTTLLMYAMTAANRSGDLRFMQKLIEKGASIDQADFSGKNVFDYMANINNPTVIDLLTHERQKID